MLDFEKLLILSENAKNAYVMVKNIKSTSECLPSDDSKTWTEFWEKHAERKFDKCACEHCNNPAEVGAHVKKADSTDGHWYIVPLCRACNNKTVSFGVKKTMLIRVNQD